MDLRIQGRNLEVTESVRSYVEKKVNRLARHVPQIKLIEVELRWEATKSAAHKAVAEVTVDVNGTLVRGEERGPTVQAALDTVADILDRRLMRYKGRLYRSEQARKAGRSPSIRELEASQVEQALAQEAQVQEEASGQVVRVKRFTMRPTTVEQAIDQMENLGHTFFMFLNAESGELNVLYRRQDGAYGIIEPQLA